MTYDSAFYGYTDRHAVRGARVVVPLLAREFPIRSVADFGCGRGAWLAAWRVNGARDTHGIDGPWLPASEHLTAADLSAPVRLDRTFDMAQSLEVAEHLPCESSAQFVETLTSHAPAVLFSAAPPGQGGMRHVNERPYGFWRDLFADRGFQLYDFVRPRIAQATIAPWYRYNILLFVRGDVPARIAATKVERHAPVADLAPPLYRLRRCAVRLVPRRVQDALARHSHRQLKT